MKIVKADAAGYEAAKTVLMHGGVVVLPTDTVYGLAAHPDFPEAVSRLYTIKARAAEKPIALLADSADGAKRFIGETAAAVGNRYWPGALTVVAQGEGVRVPDHSGTRRLIAACGGALRVTSANLSGQRAATDAPSALADVGLSADLVVDDGVSPGGVASTVVKVESGSLTVLRPGPVEFLTLASGSPRRAKILNQQGVDFTIVKSDAQEVSFPHDPERTVRENALAKGAAIKGKRVLSADTIVWFNGKIYGKPRDLDEAKAFLRELSGQTHTVFTAVAYDGQVRVVTSDVTFRTLSESQINAYVTSVKPTDRAGAYDIDESGNLIVERWTGSYENIMGLPLEPLREWRILS